MGLFRFLKRNQQPQEEVSKEKYWSLRTNDSEVIDPTWEQVEAAVKHATPEGSVFATLAYVHSGLEIEAVQVIGDEDGDWYRFEALPPNGEIYVNDGISYVETVRLFKEYFKYQRITGFRSWPTEKI